MSKGLLILAVFFLSGCAGYQTVISVETSYRGVPIRGTVKLR